MDPLKIEDMSFKIFRPRRDMYCKADQDKKLKSFRIKESQLEIVQFNNSRGQLINGSFFTPENPLPGNKCVVFTHGNSCNQLYPGYQYSAYFLQKGIYTFTFDFPGCGNSKEKYVTFGYSEPQTVIDVCDWLQQNKGIQSIALFGHSMGAVSTLFATTRDSRFVCAAHLCPFTSIRDFVQAHCEVPKENFDEFFEKVREKVQEKAAFDISEVDIMPHLSKITVPTMIGYAENDYVCPNEMAKRIFQGLTCAEKGEVPLSGLHELFGGVDPIIDFIVNHLKSA